MRIAVISDIHSNLAALESVLKAIDDERPDELWCLGDVVGYGADPDACTDLVVKHSDVCLAGNHDLVVSGALSMDSFVSSAAVAARWTADTASEQTLSFLRPLEPLALRNGYGLFHGSPLDPIWEYVLSFDQAEASINSQPEPTCFIGHSHVACFFKQDKAGTTGDQAPAGSVLDTAGDRWLLNPGSVGQPRDTDPRAAFLLLDAAQGRVEYKRVEYDIDASANAIIEAGLPRQLAERLYLGQ